jgi:hypothetical protein
LCRRHSAERTRKTNREVANDKLRAFEAKRKEAYAWLKAHGATDEQLGQLTAQQQIDVYEAAKRGESSVTFDDGRTIQIVTPGQPGSPAPTPKITPIPPSDARAAAERLGYNKVVKDPPFNAHGQKVFTNGKDYITRDVDAHIGGVWKKFNRAGQRLGTYDADLNWRAK